MKSGATLRTKRFQIISDADRLMLLLPRAGMGASAEREPERVMRDGLVSADVARALYPVAIATEGRLDRAGTVALRRP